MRSEIGKLSLDGLFSERDVLNDNIVKQINHAAGEWGMGALRYEIRDIEVSYRCVRIIILTLFQDSKGDSHCHAETS